MPKGADGRRAYLCCRCAHLGLFKAALSYGSLTETQPITNWVAGRREGFVSPGAVLCVELEFCAGGETLYHDDEKGRCVAGWNRPAIAFPPSSTDWTDEQGAQGSSA